ncbi:MULTISPECIES: hypothetical protein [Lactococcus]|uniref:Uncharacterized protein n=1 Tax=Lactococcus lactis subsp. cremoris TaxID=1359 RepID=A0A161VZJ6_LACLC|nr:hypothetical protein [Lactococcus cremoris]KZK04789.1 hypothetical protein AB996_2275 [Lactococcus cremoris]
MKSEAYELHTYFPIDGDRNRIPVNDVIVDKKLGLKLMNGVYWNYEAAPTFAIAGGTGAGKQSF